MKENMKKYIVEFIGTFFLVLTVLCCSNVGQNFAPFAISGVLATMIYAGGHISGGHYNPAVSFACCIRGALPFKQFIPYTISQILGSIVSVLIFYLLIGKFESFEPINFNLLPLFVAELLFTFALCYVVLLTATKKETAGNSYFGIAIGLTVLVGAITVGGIFSAGAFNPAVAFSIGIVNAISWKLVCITILANLIGAVIASLIFKFTNTES